MRDFNDLSEPELIEAIKHDSTDAFRRLHLMYAPRLHAFCLRWTKRKEDAEDIVQDVFARIWAGRHDIRQTETIEKLVFIMARHLLINAFKATLHAPVFEDYTAYNDRLPDDRAGIDRLEYSEFLALVNKAIDTLSETGRKVVRMSKMEGLSNREIAAELNLQEQTVKNQLSLGLKEIRRILDKHLYNDILIFMIVFVNFI